MIEPIIQGSNIIINENKFNIINIEDYNNMENTYNINKSFLSTGLYVNLSNPIKILFDMNDDKINKIIDNSTIIETLYVCINKTNTILIINRSTLLNNNESYDEKNILNNIRYTMFIVSIYDS